MIVVIALILVTVGTVLFHFMSPWWWTEIASNWGIIDTTIQITFVVTGIVFVAILLFTAYCVFRYRYRKDRRSEYKPEDPKLEWWLTGLTSVGVVIMLAPGLFAWNQFVTVPENASAFEVVAQQWNWRFRFPGKDGVLGTSDARNINDDNPFGLNPNDPNGQDDVLIDDSELHLPLGQPVQVLLRSIDVLHDFYVPEFRAKMDMVPGMITFFWFEPTRTGTFDILCFELCGIGHHEMRGTVVIEAASDFEAWLEEQETFAQSMARVEPGADNVVNLVSRETGTASAARISAQ
jgi:cytochrome c oxidase subunit 2